MSPEWRAKLSLAAQGKKTGPAREKAIAFQRYPRSAVGYFHIVAKYEPYKQRANDETCAILRRSLKQEAAYG